jgi:hypothetical protein
MTTTHTYCYRGYEIVALTEEGKTTVIKPDAP